MYIEPNIQRQSTNGVPYSQDFVDKVKVLPCLTRTQSIAPIRHGNSSALVAFTHSLVSKYNDPRVTARVCARVCTKANARPDTALRRSNSRDKTFLPLPRLPHRNYHNFQQAPDRTAISSW